MLNEMIKLRKLIKEIKRTEKRIIKKWIMMIDLIKSILSLEKKE